METPTPFKVIRICVRHDEIVKDYRANFCWRLGDPNQTEGSWSCLVEDFVIIPVESP